MLVVSIDPTTGLLPAEDQTDTLTEFFLSGTEPTERVELDAGVHDALASEQEVPEVPAMERDAETLPALPPPEDTIPLF